jgi:arylsulfatase A-like enzyme
MERTAMNSQAPHILIVTADELRKDALSCYGCKAIRTPNLDALANEAVVFDHAYTLSPWCLPARCSILTGLYPHRSGAYSNRRFNPLNSEIPNIFSALKRKGYRVSFIGKCHFAPRPYEQLRPDKTFSVDQNRSYYRSLGIDDLLLQDGKGASVWFYDDYSADLDGGGLLEIYREAVWSNDCRKVFTFPGPAELHPDSWVGRKAAEYIDSYNEDSPLFIWVSFSGPHYPFDAPVKYQNLVDPQEAAKRISLQGEYDDPRRIHHGSYHGVGGRGIDGSTVAPGNACKNYSEDYWLRLRRNYFGNVAQIDEQIGAILAAAERKLGDNMLIIFTSDHGEMLGNHGIWGKNNCGYEDVINVPLLVSYPQERKGSRTDAKVMLTDIMATCLKAAGIEGLETDGLDLKENVAQGGYPYIISEGEGFLTISDGELKYIHITKNNNKWGDEFFELYDLSADPHEFVNVIDDPEYSGRLRNLEKAALTVLMDQLLP